MAWALVFLVALVPAMAAPEITAAFDSRTATFTNTGTDFKGTLAINAVKEGLSYLLEKNVALKPGETYSIDLFKELPAGIYDIIIEGKAYKSVSIIDERSGLKRAYYGLGTITGAIVGLPGAMSMQMGIAIMAGIAILAILTFYAYFRRKKARKEIV